MKQYYTKKQYEELLDNMVILCQTNEQVNAHILDFFDSQNIKYKQKAMGEGDYSFMIKACPHLGFPMDTYFTDELFIERKNSLEELAHSLYGNKKMQPFVNEVIKKLREDIANKIPNLINLGGELINNLLNAVIANVPSLLGGGIHIIATLVSSISQQLPKLAPTALSLILKLADSLILNLPKIVTAGLELIMGLVQGLISAVPTLIEAAPTLIAHFVSAIVNMLPKIITTGIILITQLAVGLIQAIPQLISAVPKIINELKNAFSDFDWGSIGRNIIDGIKNGLSSVASNLVQAAKDAGSAALDGIKSMLGIHSPSRVFRDEVGKMMSVGLGIGFVKNLPVKSMVDGVSNAVDRMSASSLSMTANVGTSGLSPVTSHMIEDVSLNYGAAVASSNAIIVVFNLFN